jgi:glyoxylase-like metal-dependent hydrolase (beta-lactamase superfamily II)
VVLVDTGMHEPGSLAELEGAMDQVSLRIEQVRLVACTHAHSDHWGQAAPICERAGCELWLHPNHQHATEAADDPAAALERRIEVARQSGVPPAALERYAERFRRGSSGVARVIEPDKRLLDGVEIESDLGSWRTCQTPGHAPSHVCLYQPEHRLLISGDHVLGRTSLYYDYGWTSDPVGEFLHSLDVVDALDARLGLSGHGRPFVDVHGHIDACRRLVRHRLDALLHRLRTEPMTALELAPAAHEGEQLTEANASWLLSETLCYLEHLEHLGALRSAPDGGALRWRIPERQP